MNSLALTAPTASERHAQVQRDLDDRIAFHRRAAAAEDAEARSACEHTSIHFTLDGPLPHVHQMRWFTVTSLHFTKRGHWMATSTPVAMDAAHAQKRHMESLRKKKRRHVVADDIIITDMGGRP